MIEHVRFKRDARVELRASMHWYDGEAGGRGEALLEAVDAAIDAARERPYLPALVEGASGEAPIRKVRVRGFPYTVLYVVEGEVLWVLAVAHDSRRPGYWRGRLTDDEGPSLDTPTEG